MTCPRYSYVNHLIFRPLATFKKLSLSKKLRECEVQKATNMIKYLYKVDRGYAMEFIFFEISRKLTAQEKSPHFFSIN